MDTQNEPKLELTLEPDVTLEKTEAPSLPDLTLEPTPISSLETTVPPVEHKMDENLSPEELRMVDDFSQKININDSTHILQYGASAQQKMVGFSETALKNVKGKDLGDVGNMITGLVTELKEFNPDQEKGGFFSFFKKPKKIDQLQAQYSSVEKNVDNIVGQLEKHKVTLLTDIAMLDKMYEQNQNYYKELTLYILAGKKKLADVEANDLPALQAKAEASNLPTDAQAANDLANQCNRFDKKLHDLELTRTIALQMAPQIRMVQNNNVMMVEKIQSSIVNTIPLWKNQMVLTLGLVHSERAIQAQRQVTDTTNELLRRNADMLKTSTVEAAKESERGIVDLDTLKHTNESLISTLDEVLQIQQDGYQKRREAEGELQRIESELKAKLLESGARSPQ